MRHLDHDSVVRLTGLGLLCLASTCLYCLFTGPASRGDGGWAAMLQATIGFLGASLGSALFVLGRHIHDKVAISARWSQIDGAGESSSACPRSSDRSGGT